MKMRLLRLLPALLLLIAVACDAAPVDTPTPAEPTSTALPTATPTPAPTLTPIVPVPPTATPLPTPTPTPTPPPFPLLPPSLPDGVAGPPQIGAPPARPTLVPRATATPTATPTVAFVASAPTDPSCVSNPNPKLTHAITDLDKIDFMVPVVVPSGNWLKNRTYFHVKTDPATGQGYRIPVYAPVAMTLTGITRYLATDSDSSGNAIDVEQFDLRFTVSCEVEIGFDHVSSLVGEAAEVQPVEAVRDTRDPMKSVSVAYQAGDLIGYTVGTATGHTWDFIMSHFDMPLQFVNQARYEGVGDLRHVLFAACPYDYYDDPLRSQYLALAGGWGEGAVGADGADGCLGSPDVAGTIAGGWFAAPWVAGTSDYVANWGAVVVLGADGTVEINGGRRMVRTRASDPTFVTPATVTTEHCYEHKDSPAFAYLQLRTPTEMAIATGERACPASLPADFTVVHR